jgi:hypothetical protein
MEKNIVSAKPPFLGLAWSFAYNMMVNEHVILAIMNIVGSIAKTTGLISKFQNATVDAASNMLRTAATAHENPRARLRIHPPQNMVTPITMIIKPSKRPATKTPKPDASKIRPSTIRKTAQEKIT